MFYTQIMHRKLINSSTLLISSGALFILIGLIGSLFLGNGFQNSNIKGRYRFSEKTIGIPLNNYATNTPEDGQIVTPMVNPEVQKNPDSSYTSINPFGTFIHTAITDMESPKIPDRIEIPAIKLVAPVVVSDFNLTKVEGETFGQWIAPSKFATGWHPDSALVGQKGNTVINGHHNEFGEVFGHLVDVKLGDIIIVYSGDEIYQFVVANRLILAERFQTAEVRLENARWLSETDDIRLTLVTCWPKESNTHRLIIVARPLSVN